MSHGDDASPRVALGVEYDGTDIAGWQTQSHAPSVQDALDEAISRVAAARINCVGAGRTDSGVHATGQVLHFDTEAMRSSRQWVLGINANLSDDINVCWARKVPEDFHARYSAVSRAYRYLILNRPVRTALNRNRAWWLHGTLDLEAMMAAGRVLVGEHDFSAFRAAACQSKNPVRELTRLEIQRRGDFILIDCEANAFLHHMVRNIVGSLVKIGQGEASVHWLGELLESRDRRLAGMTAPAHGLYLTRVSYPQEYGLPAISPGGGVICV